MKLEFKKENAITLVALIITIIVLLILAMVSISLVMNSGIITKSKTAVDKYSEEEIQEQIKLAYSEWQMGQYSGVTEDAPTFIQKKLNSIYGPGTVANVTAENGILTVELTNGKTYTYNVATGVASKVKTVAEYPEATPGTPTTENSKYTSNNKTAVIPAGYSISNVATEQSIDNGLVISKDGNEWVWIPVENVTELYDTNTSDAEWVLCGTSGDNKVVSTYASKSQILTGSTRTTPGTTGFKEPDTVVGNGTQYDTVEANYTAAGFTSFSNMATSLRDDYKNMIDSVRKYGGFYVGRYELSNSGTKKGEATPTNTNWYGLYAKCKTIGSDSTESRMIWGCMFDEVCKFISTSGDEVSLTSWDSYGNRIFNAMIKTGSNDNYKANNIYDLAGNYLEWTQEARNSEYRSAYGGTVNNSNGSVYPMTNKLDLNPITTHTYYSGMRQQFARHIFSPRTLYKVELSYMGVDVESIRFEVEFIE